MNRIRSYQKYVLKYRKCTILEYFYELYSIILKKCKLTQLIISRLTSAKATRHIAMALNNSQVILIITLKRISK